MLLDDGTVQGIKCQTDPIPISKLCFDENEIKEIKESGCIIVKRYK